MAGVRGGARAHRVLLLLGIVTLLAAAVCASEAPGDGDASAEEHPGGHRLTVLTEEWPGESADGVFCMRLKELPVESGSTYLRAYFRFARDSDGDGDGDGDGVAGVGESVRVLLRGADGAHVTVAVALLAESNGDFASEVDFEWTVDEAEQVVAAGGVPPGAALRTLLEGGVLAGRVEGARIPLRQVKLVSSAVEYAPPHHEADESACAAAAPEHAQGGPALETIVLEDAHPVVSAPVETEPCGECPAYSFCVEMKEVPVVEAGSDDAAFQVQFVFRRRAAWRSGRSAEESADEGATGGAGDALSLHARFGDAADSVSVAVPLVHEYRRQWAATVDVLGGGVRGAAEMRRLVRNGMLSGTATVVGGDGGLPELTFGVDMRSAGSDTVEEEAVEGAEEALDADDGDDGETAESVDGVEGAAAAEFWLELEQVQVVMKAHRFQALPPAPAVCPYAPWRSSSSSSSPPPLLSSLYGVPSAFSASSPSPSSSSSDRDWWSRDSALDASWTAPTRFSLPPVPSLGTDGAAAAGLPLPGEVAPQVAQEADSAFGSAEDGDDAQQLPLNGGGGGDGGGDGDGGGIGAFAEGHSSSGGSVPVSLWATLALAVAGACGLCVCGAAALFFGRPLLVRARDPCRALCCLGRSRGRGGGGRVEAELHEMERGAAGGGAEAQANGGAAANAMPPPPPPLSAHDVQMLFAHAVPVGPAAAAGYPTPSAPVPSPPRDAQQAMGALSNAALLLPFRRWLRVHWSGWVAVLTGGAQSARSVLGSSVLAPGRRANAPAPAPAHAPPPYAAPAPATPCS